MGTFTRQTKPEPVRQTSHSLLWLRALEWAERGPRCLTLPSNLQSLADVDAILITSKRPLETRLMESSGKTIGRSRNGTSTASKEPNRK
jgi:hypothetical protein